MNAILKKFLFVSSIYLLAPTAGAFSLNDSISSGTQALSSTEVNGEARQLLGQLQDQLGVTETQAVGGTGALLQLAKSGLDTDSLSALTSKAPGLSNLLGGSNGLGSSLLSSISSMNGVQSAFSALGMDSAMIQQFVPIVMSFLGGQGAGSSLLGQLQNLWTPTG